MSVAYEPRSFIHDGSYPPIGETHDMTEMHDIHDPSELNESHDMPNNHDPVHELQTAQDVTDVADVADVTELAGTHEIHEAHHVHEVQHEVHQVHELQADDGAQFDDADVATELAAAVNGYHSHVPESLMSEAEQRLVIVEGLPVMSNETHMMPKQDLSPSGLPRLKAISKPDRKATKNITGKFACTAPDCTEEIREFSRKCEWNKHMDKHDRPYKCTAEGCEKLPGFTYSGGLLRHEREVHAKHGGPKNPLNCPHTTCKRHTGKGFSRQENLNEHLRRCHRNGSPANLGGDTDEAGSETGIKRRRDSGDDDVAELRAEVKKQRLENDELRMKLDNQTQQIAQMMQQITDLQRSRELMH